MVVVRNIQGLVAQQSQHSFEELIKQKKDKIVRDSFVFLSPDGDGSDSLTAGYTVIYPGCRTAGHSARVEEL